MKQTPFAFEKALKNQTKKEILADKLIEMILTGLLRDGDELPSERELAQLFEVSRETVRGGLALLTGYGLLNVSHGSKSRVCASEAVIDSFRNHPARQQGDELNNLDIESVFESRIVVESAIARRAARHIDEVGLKKLDALLEAQSQHFDSPVNFQLSDQNFHHVIAEYSRNEILIRYADELYTYALNIRRQVMAEHGSIKRSYEEHVRIVEALRAGDPDAAERAMLSHIDSVYYTTKDKMKH
ncbi:FadR/GntR family transcriptional regulator [Cobetia amphilecti]|uniref:FadR/GntR family transcriptional regulator n=1 Tax=Cobetia amphilecti TaxID=1055104 RepID=A0ABT6UTR0_9GAMM|nr:FadR/GntR family transcriptional regulator [Cobetia amphilecti]MBR9754220.1 FadR family transcriptional regulator [Gammaproteobacteria bacterium]MDI5885735.1 FadR/GntR family transcriptional regulator [Cobetia amphilecti]TCJ26463.1 FadR family transcriptional regulator [Halomonas sp. GDM18]UTV86699.1 FadR family transcriptional regulator [Cobetia litoralis]